MTIVFCIRGKIMKDFDSVRKIKKEIERAIILDAGVVSIGTVREKDEQGQDTENYSIQVGLISRADTTTIKLIRRKIAALLEMTDEIGAQSVKSNDIKIRFIEEGKINALSLDSIEIPSTDDSTTLEQKVDEIARIRPLIGGISIGHPQVTAGTLGSIVTFSSHVGEHYILSNNHVMANTNNAELGSPILQPGVLDGGIVESDKVGALTFFHPIDPSGIEFNDVDTAIAKIDGDIPVNCSITSIGQPQEIKAAVVGMDVEKTGRTTGHTYGKIISVDETTKVNMGSFTTIFQNQIASTTMSAGGDSGSVVFERGTKKPVGLLFAASKTTTYSNHMPSVSTALAKAGFFGMSFSNKKRDFSTSCPISKNAAQKAISQDILSIALRVVPRLLRR